MPSDISGGYSPGASGWRVDCGARVEVEAVPARGSDAAPSADEQVAAEEVGPDLEAIVAVPVALGQDANEGCRFREERGLDRSGPSEGRLATSGHRVVKIVTRTRTEH